MVVCFKVYFAFGKVRNDPQRESLGRTVCSCIKCAFVCKHVLLSECVCLCKSTPLHNTPNWATQIERLGQRGEFAERAVWTLWGLVLSVYTYKYM